MTSCSASISLIIPYIARSKRSASSVPRGAVTRDDTAAVLAALLDNPGTIGQTLELVEGDDDVFAAVAAIALTAPADDDADDPGKASPEDTAAAGPGEVGPRE